MDNTNNNYKLSVKSGLKRIDINDFKTGLPNLKDTDEPKAIIIARWLAERIKSAFDLGKFKESEILPSKADFAYLLGVSVGTIQHAIRHLEDLGYVESKQCIGTVVRDYTKPVTMRKFTSKRDLAIEAIKRYIINDGFSVGSSLPSSYTIATIIGFSVNITRFAIDALVADKILKRKIKKAKDSGWIVLSLDINLKPSINTITSVTLVEKTAQDIERYIAEELKQGDRMPAHQELSKKLKVSIKTVHDAVQILIKKGYLWARRGTYGTWVVKMPNLGTEVIKPEDEIFASAKDTAFYHYEKTQNYIKKIIAENYEVGDKLPSISTLSAQLKLSQNTIRTAFHNLSKEGYLVFSRGRYGGTFIIDIPEIEGKSFKWLAVNPSFAKEYQQLDEN